MCSLPCRQSCISPCVRVFTYYRVRSNLVQPWCTPVCLCLRVFALVTGFTSELAQTRCILNCVRYFRNRVRFQAVSNTVHTCLYPFFSMCVCVCSCVSPLYQGSVGSKLSQPLCVVGLDLCVYVCLCVFVCVFIVHQGSGMSERQRAYCDSFVYISQYGGGTASLNVTVATSIILHRFSAWRLDAARNTVGDGGPQNPLL